MSENNVTYAGEAYSKFRPSYSPEIYKLIDQFHSKNHGSYELAIDVGCGTGQSTVETAKKFQHVYGIDNLADQIEHSTQRDNITYQVGAAEDLSQFKNGSVDMITSGTAFHWFQHDVFFKEAKRVLKPNGTLAIYSYFFPVLKNVPDETNAIIKHLTLEEFGKYANDNIRFIQNLYRDIKFPFKDQNWYITPASEDTTHISQPVKGSLMEASMTMARFSDYLKTSSTYYNYLKDPSNKGKPDPVDTMIEKLMDTLKIKDANQTVDIEWPTVLVLAKND
ncbi:S-adenosyl-L-methionine-dependent methyltransferase [Pilaira anomala]|nr:S-adenosyl-L-methionine-dependent methyltransferase [Pilaira anomala]